jgi:integrase
MRIAHHLIRVANGVYYFRQWVPLDLQAALGRRFVQTSLRTRDARAAKVYALTLSLRYAEVFAELRGTAMPKSPRVDDIVANAPLGAVRPYEMDVDPATLLPTRIRTDGTPQDNQAVLDALQALGNLRVALAQPLPDMSPRLPAATKKPPSVLTLAAAIKLYEEAEAASLKPNTWSQRKRAFASLKAAIGGTTPVAQITREKAGDWAHGLMTQPSSKLKDAPMSKRSAGNSVSHAAQLFAFLAQRGKWVGPNPVKGVVVMTKKEKARRKADGFQWEPLDVAALQRVFDPANLGGIRTVHTKWAALIGLFTGARVGEVAQLYLSDFIEEDGIPCIRIATDSDGQSLKTEASRRLVPIHPGLVELGLLERVKELRRQGKERLFDGMRIDGKAGAGNAISKGFGYYLDKLGIKPRRANGIVGFHSLRKTVIQELQGSRLPAERRRAFVGHEPGDDVHESVYMRPWSAGELAELFPGLSWGSWLEFDRLKTLLRG